MVSIKGKYPKIDPLSLSMGELEEAVSCMNYLRGYIIQLYPEKFPPGNKPAFSLVLEEVKGLISKYYNLKNLVEP